MKNTLLPISIFVLYLLALNPYIGPGLYDDVIYLMGAESISKGEGYTFNGQIIGDWPPLFSIILSLPLYFGVPLVEAGKGVVLLFAFLGLFLANKLMKVEERKNRLAVLTLFALSPTSFVWSTRVMTEWVFVCFVFLLFLFLHQKGSVRRILVSGVIFACAFLTRYTGLFLLAPIGAQMWLQKKKGNLLIGCIGIALFIGFWVVPVQQGANTNVRYYGSFEKILDKFNLNFPYFLELLTSYMTGINKINPFTESLGAITGFFLLLLIFIGFYKQKKILFTDVWAFTVLGVSLVFYFKLERYLLPAGLFLFCYVLAALERIFPRMIFKGILTLWILLFVTFDVYLLIKGNERTYNGLNLRVSPTEKHYYRGYWLDLYEVSQVIIGLPKNEKISFLGKDLEGLKYIIFFTRRQVTADPSGKGDVLLINTLPLPKDKTLIYQNQSFSLMR